MGSSMATPSITSVSATAVAETEVVAKAVRQRFSAEYKLRILQEADNCSSGEIGALLRRLRPTCETYTRISDLYRAGHLYLKL